jgi:hypothetical protein
MDPYIIAGIGIALILSLGALVVRGIYNRRTQEPNINLENAISNIAPKIPEMEK